MKPIGKFKYTSPITGYVTEGEYFNIKKKPEFIDENCISFKYVEFILSTSGIGYLLEEVEIDPYDSTRSI